MKELITIQSELKAPKNLRNSFGNYNYRSAEGILESVKPLLLKTNCTLTISDEIECVGDRIYVKATATLTNGKGETISTSAFAREPLQKKGQDESQVTGAASSYARKYALNGLFAIDDTKDADALNVNPQYTQPVQQAVQQAVQAPNQNRVNEAIGKVQGAKTSQEVKDIFKAYPDLKDVKDFYDLVITQGKKLAKAEKENNPS